MHGSSLRASLLLLTRVWFDSVRHLSAAGWKMFYRDSFAYTCLLQRCDGLKSLKEIHAQIITCGYEQNPFLAAKLVSRYAEDNGSNMEDARKVFDRVSERDVLMWNVVIRGYASSGASGEAVKIYDHMRRKGVLANQYTYPFVLKACAALGDGNKGQVIHGHVVKVGLEWDLFVGNALVSFYAKCKEIEMARRVFDQIPQKDLVSWNTMIAGYTQNEHPNDAIMTLHQMLRDDTVGMPDHATIVGALPACTQAATIQEGMLIHSYIVKSGMEVDVALGSGLIAMYGNCGRLKTARNLFDRLLDRNIVVWNAIIRCYGMHGLADEALEIFSQMVDSGVRPDGICFVCLLSACSHVGWVDKGWELFGKMEDHGVEKRDEHYACMVDLLGRAGRLNEAVKFINEMPVEAGKDVYGALLGACRIHNNIELAEKAAERLFILDPDNAGRYVLLAKMYEDAGRWEDAARLRKLMKEKQVRKPLGSSMVEVDSVVHTFGVEDESHSMKVEIFDTLESLRRVMAEDWNRERERMRESEKGRWLELI
ncbi:PREDICTED: pentatricopeptide repeat-containing protein At3g46790, chloroplastic-like [Nelumbo nucifera]|uniref:Pentatricopeptide repeat-containing protein At3g46790, chloroplastic-like n=1 Tax=Nelumbo nucifera TaxID=4432 RepID=A0A1U7ZMC5_NELNU|nr:PREDICTED: pentatricopeptide repeat-containing protein At3g46790, chloroplastic-like [Nelumbo nucifera]XP_010255240.1 PREDICTED: pentatricopeptide repeat-containing protein At3g46790, chloroplastic-like [Nelumbo nucifera]XP_010255241.1 PREDICTED: pentatricopeptide repeat-containing protein At3g46790, chloroplastic-like [Nelumbo nucifera]XP_010255242.1 PREDICTED: pentatricopeptide repeat-containing protein At3g46790, chloroplastic-like [Nelumbo nucifera]XP_019053082.1 PREDICTED: pentatricopep